MSQFSGNGRLKRPDFIPNFGGYDVFLIVTQSNAIGRYGPIDAGLDALNDRIKQLGRQAPNNNLVIDAEDPLEHIDPTANTVGFGLSFAKAYLPSISSNRQVLLVPCAEGGTGFSTNDWNVGDANYEDAIARANTAMAAGAGVNQFKGILVSGGESDAGVYGESGYAQRQDLMIADMRTRITGAAHAPVIWCDLVAGWNTPTSNDVRAAIADIGNRLPYTAFVDTSDLAHGGDGLHYSAASQRIIGERMNTALATALANTAVAAEAGVTGHWLFGADNTPLLDLTSTKLLTPVGTDPVHSAGYLTTVSSNRHGLLSDVDDSDTQTVCAVVNLAAADQAIIAGSLNANIGEGGSAILVQSTNDANVNSRGIANDVIVNPYPTGWVFIAYSISPTQHIGFIGGGTPDTVTQAGTKTEASPMRQIGVGNCHYANGAWYNGIDCAEFMIFDGVAKSIAELSDIYDRSVTRLAARGITVV